MNTQRSAMIFLGNDLTEEEFVVEEKRQEALEQGIETILQHISDLQIVTRNDFACTVSVTGSTDMIAKLKQFVQDSNFCEVELDVFERPAFRPAMD